MKLHPFDEVTAMPHAHDLPFGGARTHFELDGHLVGGGDERMIAADLARLRQSCEHRARVMRNE